MNQNFFHTSFATSLSAVVFVSGLLAVGGCALFGIFCILSIIQIAMISSRDRVCMSYKALVLLKLVATILAVGLSIAAAILFALQTDDYARGYQITRGISFYLQILVTALSLALLALAAYDRILTNRPDGDPTMLSNATANGRGGAGARTGSTYNNPGFRETSHNPNGKWGERANEINTISHTSLTTSQQALQ